MSKKSEEMQRLFQPLDEEAPKKREVKALFSKNKSTDQNKKISIPIDYTLSDRGFNVYQNELNIEYRNAGIAYLLCCFFGVLGAHKFYLEKKSIGITYLVITAISLLLGFTQILGLFRRTTLNLFLCYLGPFIMLILFIYDLLTIANQVRDYNYNLKKSLLIRLDKQERLFEENCIED